MKWCVSAWTIWGLRAEWTLNMGTEASKGWLFCGDAARSRISQDRKNVLFEKLCILWFWIYLQDSGLVTTAGFALGGRWASNRLKERRTWTGWKNIFWRWRLQDFDNYPGQAKYVFILRIVQTVALKNCRTCAAITCYVRKLDHWFKEERSYLIMRS